MAFAQVAPAQTITGLNGQDEYSQREQVGFAFYRLAHAQPRFDDWLDVAEEAAFKADPNAMPLDRQAQVRRLQKGLNNYVPQRDVINITSSGVVNAPVLPAQDINGTFKDQRPVELAMGDSMDPADLTLFTFQLGHVWIAIVPEHDAAFKTIMMPMPYYSKMAEVLGLSNAVTSAGVGIRLIMRPVRVEKRAPVVVDNKKKWLMTAKIENLEIWDLKFQNLLWSYNAADFKSDETQDLLLLYKSR